MAENLDFLFQGFAKLSRAERLTRLQQMADLNAHDLDVLEGKDAFNLDLAENFIENVVGYMPVPIGIATYFRIDGRDLPIPMAVEETSIIAAASSAAKFIRSRGGSITTKSEGNLIIGQVQFPNVQNPEAAADAIQANEAELLAIANAAVPGLVRRGGGVHSFQIRLLYRPQGDGKMLVLHIFCDPCDAMGANLINQVCEAVKPSLEAWTNEKIGMCILSNLVDSKLTSAEVRLPMQEEDFGHGIQEASFFAEADPYRATTHNKGVLNGIDPIIVATGNDWRAVEAGVHAYCTRKGKYEPITTWRYQNQELVGKFKAPIAVGTVGGVTRLHPTAKVCLRMLQTNSAAELARIMAAVGLVQNFGALRALSTVGIVKGHMQLHAANLAIAAGAEKNEMADLKEQLIAMLRHEKMITLTHAKELLRKMRGIVSDTHAP